MKVRSKNIFLSIAVMICFYIVNGQDQKTFYNVRNFGAKGDGSSIDSEPVNEAIEAAASAGGGTVYFPAGHYKCFSIRLKSNISLYLDQGAVIIGAKPIGSVHYDDPEPNTSYDAYQDFGHNHWKNSLIWGIGLHNISIVGQGMIWGEGLVRNANEPKDGGNKAIAFKNCYNVNLQNFSVLHGGHFALLATGVDNLAINNLKIDTDRDGFDIDCCKNVFISNCLVNSPTDDAICLKSSFALGYAKPTENVTIANCQVSGYMEGTLLDGTFKKADKNYTGKIATGRIKFGTESNGGFKNIAISNCIFNYSRGLALETVDGALLEDIAITNITMRDIGNAPLFIRLGARMRGPDTIAIGQCHRIIISNLIAYNVDANQGAIISGIPGHDLEDIQLNNIRIYYKGGGLKSYSSRIVPEFEKDYPEPYLWNIMPSYGFFIRHVKNLKMHDVEVSYSQQDWRPPFILQDVSDADIHNIRLEKEQGIPSFLLKNATDLSLDHIKVVKSVPTSRFK
jgi:polygalacturonase